MSDPTQPEISAHLASLSAPASGLGELHALAERLCAAQGTLRPVTTPRRLVLFAADHGPDAESAISDAIHDLVSGGAVTAVLAKSAHAELVVVDVGSRCDALVESHRYRSLKTRAGSCDFEKQPALTADEFRAAFEAGQKEADLAHAAHLKVVAADAVGAESVTVAERVLALKEPADDPMGRFGAVGGSDIAAIAGFTARAAELGLVVLVASPAARAGLHVAERVRPETRTRVVARGEPFPPSPSPKKGGEEVDGGRSSDGLGAVLAFPLLDAAAAAV
ncbi:MAG TPA: nicotinate-nucleotide--dimethylbenzimidazole phosphoribosyltransferase, partial [Gemmata sp.]